MMPVIIVSKGSKGILSNERDGDLKDMVNKLWMKGYHKTFGETLSKVQRWRVSIAATRCISHWRLNFNSSI